MHGGLENGLGTAGERDDAPVMVQVAGAVQNDHTGHGGDSAFERSHAGQVAAFGKIGHTFDERLTQTALAFGRFRFKTRLPSRMARATWLIPKRRGISR